MKRSDRFNLIVDAIFDFLSSVVGNFASNVVPLLAGIVPAYMTWDHITGVLGFPEWVGLAGAGVVEFMGLGAGNELMRVWNHNRRYKDKTNKMPMLAPLTTAVWYIAIMISFNVVLETFPDSRIWRIISVALFASLAAPAYFLVAGKTLRMEWKTERTNELYARRMQRANERTNGRTNERANERTSERTNGRTNERSERTNAANERTNERANERANERTNRTNERTERTNDIVRSQIEQYVRSVRAREKRTPGPTEIANGLGVSKGYASDTLKWMFGQNQQYRQ